MAVREDYLPDLTEPVRSEQRHIDRASDRPEIHGGAGEVVGLLARPVGVLREPRQRKGVFVGPVGLSDAEQERRVLAYVALLVSCRDESTATTSAIHVEP